jgi:transmembrane sensor
MSNLLRFPNNRRDKEEAGQWLARVDRGLTQAEHVELSEWLREPRHREALFRLARDWDSMAVLEELAELFPLTTDEGVSWRFAGGVAVVSLLAICATAVLFYIRTHSRNATETRVTSLLNDAARDASFSADYATPVGEHRTVELPDHSEIRLNTNTELHVEYSATARLLTMSRGEAIFQVAKDPNRAFTVRAAGYDFNAIGTAFDIRADASGCLRLTVTEGRVRLRRTAPAEVKRDSARAVAPPPVGDTTDVLVEANKAVSIGPHRERVDVLTRDQVADATAWQHGVIVFKATPLAQVVDELSRYSTVRFVIAEPELAQLPVSGYFEIGNIDDLSAALEQNVGVKITKHNGYLLLSTSQPSE